MIRVSKDPDDKAYSPTAGQRRVWVNDHEVDAWITADEFRRVVITEACVMNGSVRIERLVEDNPSGIAPADSTDLPANVGFAGAGLVSSELVTPDLPITLEDPEPEQLELPTGDEHPGSPDEAVVVTQSERLQESDSQE